MRVNRMESQHTTPRPSSLTPSVRSRPNLEEEVEAATAALAASDDPKAAEMLASFKLAEAHPDMQAGLLLLYEKSKMVPRQKQGTDAAHARRRRRRKPHRSAPQEDHAVQGPDLDRAYDEMLYRQACRSSGSRLSFDDWRAERAWRGDVEARGRAQCRAEDSPAGEPDVDEARASYLRRRAERSRGGAT